jgi:hypothetical protein
MSAFCNAPNASGVGPFAWKNLISEIDEPRTHSGIGQCLAAAVLGGADEVIE